VKSRVALVVSQLRPPIAEILQLAVYVLSRSLHHLLLRTLLLRLLVVAVAIFSRVRVVIVAVAVVQIPLLAGGTQLQQHHGSTLRALESRLQRPGHDPCVSTVYSNAIVSYVGPTSFFFLSCFSCRAAVSYVPDGVASSSSKFVGSYSSCLDLTYPGTTNPMKQARAAVVEKVRVCRE